MIGERFGRLSVVAFSHRDQPGPPVDLGAWVRLYVTAVLEAEAQPKGGEAAPTERIVVA
jgi:hypothetical protein